LIQLSEYPFLINSDEFRIFARPEFTGGNADVEKQLAKLNKIQPESLATKLTDVYGFTEEQVKELV